MRPFPAALLVFLLLTPTSAQKYHPGTETFTPTRMDWLVTTLQASLRQDASMESPFVLSITDPDSETIVLYVRYFSNVERTIMNKRHRYRTPRD
jgi:hypothetical protein